MPAAAAPALSLALAAGIVYGAGLRPALNDPNVRGNGWNEATSLIYSRLYRVGLKGTIEPDLVERDEVSADGLVWRLRLRRGVVWHDGTPFTSADVRATMASVFDPNAPCDLDLNLPMVAGFEYPGSDTVVIRLKQPAPLLRVPLAEIAILPQAAGGVPDAGAVGTGPYRFEASTDDGRLRFVRHERFHLGAPAIERIELREIPDGAARAAALAAGELDVALVPSREIAAVAGHAGIRIVRMATGAWRGMPLNLRRPALKDRRVRQAIDLALDREAIVREALPDGGVPAWQPLPAASWAFARDLDRSYRDVRKAKGYLDWAGWTPGPDGLRRRHAEGPPLTLRLIVWKDEPFRRIASEVVARQLRAIGIQVERHLVDNVEYNRLAEAMGEEYDGFIGGWGALLDPGDNLYKKFHSTGSQNHMGFSDPEIDRLLERARARTDPKAASPIYRRLLQRLREEAVVLPLACPDYLFGVSSRVAGIGPAVVDSWYEFPRNAHLWSLR